MITADTTKPDREKDPYLLNRRLVFTRGRWHIEHPSIIFPKGSRRYRSPSPTQSIIELYRREEEREAAMEDLKVKASFQVNDKKEVITASGSEKIDPMDLKPAAVPDDKIRRSNRGQIKVNRHNMEDYVDMTTDSIQTKKRVGKKTQVSKKKLEDPLEEASLSVDARVADPKSAVAQDADEDYDHDIYSSSEGARMNAGIPPPNFKNKGPPIMVYNDPSNQENNNSRRVRNGSPDNNPKTDRKPVSGNTGRKQDENTQSILNDDIHNNNTNNDEDHGQDRGPEIEDDYEDEYDMTVPSYILYMAGIDSYNTRQLLQKVIGMNAIDIPFIEKDSVANAIKTLRRHHGIHIPESRVITIWISIQIVQQAMSQNIVINYDTIREILTVDNMTRFHKFAKGDVKANQDIKPPSADKDVTNMTWRKWYSQLCYYLRNQYSSGVGKVPLYYIIRENITAEQRRNLSAENARIYDSPHIGTTYEEDRATVWKLMVSLLNGHGTYSYIKPFEKTQDATAAMNALRAYFDGPVQIQARKEEAYKNIDSIYYNGNEKSFSFHSFITTLKENYQVLEECGVVNDKDRMIRHMISKIQVQNDVVKYAINGIKQTLISSTEFTFDQAVQSLSAAIKDTMEVKIKTTSPNKNIGAANLLTPGRDRQQNGRGGEGRGRGRGRGYQGRGSPGGRGRGRGRGRFTSPGGRDQNIHRTENGVDVSRIDRTYSRDEWSKLSEETRSKIRQYRHDRNESKGRYNISKANLINGFEERIRRLEEEKNDQQDATIVTSNRNTSATI